MPLWEWLLDSIGVVLVLFLLCGILLFCRRRHLSRDGGTFECSYRVRSSGVGRGWLLGVARYSGDRLQWFRLFSFALGPKRTWRRGDLRYVEWRHPIGAEQLTLYGDHVVVTCTAGGEEIKLAMHTSSLMGLQAWLEAGPPGGEV